MKKITHYILLAVGTLLMLASCGENDIYVGGSGGRPGGGDDGDDDVPACMAEYEVHGVVTDVDGNALEGVSVVSGDASTVTLASGVFALDRSNLQYGHSVVKFTKPGYFPVTKSLDIEEANVVCKVVMAPKGNSSHTASVSFDSGRGHTLKAGGLTIDFPADGFKRRSDGSAYSGTVNVDVLHLSPDNADFYEMMPGDLSAVDADGQYKTLISYGMANVVMTDNGGNALQLADGSEATVRFEIPETMTDAPAEIPLWSFSDAEGVWREEQMATRQSDGSYVGKVSHFSWANLDTPEDIAYLDGHVITTEGAPVKHTCVTVDGFRRVYTDDNGYFRCRVPSWWPFPVTVLPEDYGNYSSQVVEHVDPIPAGDTRTIQLVLPVLYKVYGRITDQNGDPVRTFYNMELDYLDDVILRFGDFISGRDGYYECYLPWEFVGNGKIIVDAPNGTTVEEEYFVPGYTDVEVNVTVPTGGGTPGGGGGGDADITAECRGEALHALSVVRPGNKTLGGVMIEDDRLVVMTGGGEFDPYSSENQMIIYVEGYNPGKSEFDGAMVMAQDGQKLVVSQSGTLNVTRSGTNFFFTFEGEGYYVDYASDNPEPKPGIIRVHNVDVMHFFTAETHVGYTPSAPIPSFCPRLSTPAPVASVITESKKLGTGGMLFYDGGKNDFTSLCNQASKSGLSRIFYDYDEEYGEGEAAYQGTKKYVMLEYCADGEKIDAEKALQGGVLIPRMSADGEVEGYEMDAQLAVMALQDGTMSIFDLMAGGGGFNAPRKAAPIWRSAKSAGAVVRKMSKRK